MMFTGVIGFQAMGLQYISMGSGINVYIQGYNEVGVKGTGAYGTNKNKVVKGVKVRLKEGSYNKTANNYAEKGGWTTKLKKKIIHLKLLVQAILGNTRLLFIKTIPNSIYFC
ncbi:hypothetical protein [Paraliobacillus ryukyuensis]|uniref:hypothetical protein n=1 Tax=Paraliobacillus ryukyuensis TaxID=200904 RepID=UPI0021196881|nr:hypothetical protein [Paraliobacillus ryukyuensis]